MLPEIHKNAVMHGCIDYFCLVCEELLKHDHEVEAHITKPVHRSNLEKTLYVESCSSDHIRKVKKGYYCQFCNMLVSTMAKINLHIKDEKHLFNKMDDSDGDIKRSAFLKWVKNAVIAFDDVLIDEFTWNGFIDNTCMICDVEFDDADIHKNETEHILKLIQAKVQIGADNISRKVDDSTYQCLTCNTVIPTSEMMTHFDKPEHSKIYLECRKAKRAFFNKNVIVANQMESPKLETSSKTYKESNIQIDQGEKKAQDKKEEEEKKRADEQKKEDENKKEEEKNKEEEKKRQDENKKELERKRQEEMKKEAEKKTEEAERKREEAKKKEEELKKEQARKREEEMKKEEEKKKEAERKKEEEKKKTKEVAETKSEDASSKKVPQKGKRKIKKEYVSDICDILGISNYMQVTNDFQVHCLLCDLDVASCQESFHVNSLHHKRLLTLQNERAQKMRAKYSRSEDKNTISPANREAEKNRTKISASAAEFQKKNVQIDLINDKAYCSDCSQTVKFIFEDIEKHIADHKNKVAASTGEKYPAFNKSDCKKTAPAKSAVKTEVMIDEETEKFAEDNQLRLIQSSNMAFCTPCQLKVPLSLKSMKQHVNGTGHQTLQKKPEVERPESPLYRTKPMKYFVETCTIVENMFRHDAVINDDICVNVSSFMFLTQMDGVIECLACDETVNDAEEHHKTKMHQKVMQETPVLYTIDSEFIREVRDEIYHCGFCNETEAGWDDLQEHLKSYPHKSNRESCEYAWEQHMPAIRKQRAAEQRQTAEYEFLMRLMVGAHFKQF
ncbi:transcriptional regulator ATRX homolog [Plutella xylostella]|uniref:transcriptional regulator ATRX homolog n=1 Tax=Plutella xylostella TaxID=51655 RepID=UPI00203314B4|nr:transcriptional regulator ATRX homolog [Plutella xylostella]